MANKMNDIPSRALEIANQVGETLRDRIPDSAIKWVETGAALGAIRAGTRVASGFVRRNPLVAVATAAGAGLLWLAARNRAKQAREAPIAGTATRVEAKRAADPTQRTRRTPAGKRPSMRRTTKTNTTT